MTQTVENNQEKPTAQIQVADILKDRVAFVEIDEDMKSATAEYLPALKEALPGVFWMPPKTWQSKAYPCVTLLHNLSTILRQANRQSRLGYGYRALWKRRRQHN